MAAVLFRIVLLALGLGTVEIGLGEALVNGSPFGAALALVVGLPLIVGGSAGFIVPLLSGKGWKGATDE